MRCSSLYVVATKTPIFPCFELLEWIIHHVDEEKCLLNNKDGECIDVFLSIEVSMYYKIKYTKVRLHEDFLVMFYESHNIGPFLVFSCR
jgi:hypothetical protein